MGWDSDVRSPKPGPGHRGAMSHSRSARHDMLARILDTMAQPPRSANESRTRDDLRSEVAGAVGVRPYPPPNLGERGLEGLDRAGRAALLAWLAREHGHYAKAARWYNDAAAHSDSPWLPAEEFVCGYRAAAGDAEREALLEKLETRIGADADRAVGAPLRWARAMIDLEGHEADYLPNLRQIEAARAQLRGAQRMIPRSPRLCVATLVAGTLEVVHDGDRRKALRRHSDEIGRVTDMLMRGELDVHDATLPYDYLDLRRELHLAAGYAALDGNRLVEAANELKRALESDPGHQGARTWSVYCRRCILLKGPQDLVAEVNKLLNGDDTKEARVVNPDLVADLLTERATLLEDSNPAKALEDYRAALENRPRLAFAIRGEMRCHVALGLYDDAEGLANEHVAKEKTDAERRGVPLRADVLVEAGRVKHARGKLDAAIKLFETAIAARPLYGLGYEARVVTRREQGNHRRAIDEAVKALDEHGARMRGATALRVELGHTHLGCAEFDEAIEQFEMAIEPPKPVPDETSPLPAVPDRARGGLIDALVRARRFVAARNHWSNSPEPAGSRTLAAAGRMFVEVGDFTAALDCFDRALEQRPHGVGPIVGKARALRFAGRPTEAERLVRQSLAAVPEHAAQRLHNELGWIALEAGRDEQARDQFDAVLDGDRRNEEAHRGRVAATARTAGAVAVRRVVEAARTDLDFEACGRGAARLYFEAAIGCLRRGDLTAGREWMGRITTYDAVRAMREAHELLQCAALIDAQARIESILRDDVAAQVDDPRLLLLRGRLCLSTRDPHGAMQAFGLVSRDWPGSVTAQRGAALGHMLVDQFKRAEELLEHAIEQHPGDLLAREQLVAVLIRLHEAEVDAQAADSRHLQRAAAVCEEVRTGEPGRSVALESAGLIAALRGHNDAAELYLEEAIKVDPDRDEPKLCRAALHLRLGRGAKARALLEAVAGSASSRAAAALLRARAHLECGETASAQALLREAMLLEPSDWQAPLELAQVLRGEGQSEDAIALLTTALGIVPIARRRPILLARACARHDFALGAERHRALRNALLDEALDDIGVAARSSGVVGRFDASEVHYHRGVVLHARGRPAAARREFEACLEGGREHVPAKHALQQIKTHSTDDVDQRRLRWIGNLIVGAAFVLLVLVVGLTLLHNIELDPFPSASAQAAGVLLFVMVVAASLPRLASLSFGKSVELSMQAPRPAADAGDVTLRFGSLRSVSSMSFTRSFTMPGPGTHEPPEPRSGSERTTAV